MHACVHTNRHTIDAHVHTHTAVSTSAAAFITLVQKSMWQQFKFDHYSMLEHVFKLIIIKSLVASNVATNQGAAFNQWYTITCAHIAHTTHVGLYR